MDKSCYIIAEAGVNHNGSLELARKLIDAAVEAGADAVKFQTFKADKLVTKTAAKADYQKSSDNAGESQHQMIRKLELSADDHLELVEYCNTRDIQFLSTAFDSESAEFLQGLSLPFAKIPSGEITNLPHLRQTAKAACPIILSTGMANLGEVEAAVNVLVNAGTSRANITILQCHTDYPTRFEDANLKAMQTLAAAFPGTKVGYSDHTLGIEAPIAAVAMGATLVEKHFTLDRTLPGPDHAASLEPAELKSMVQSIRNVELALGHGRKEPSASELKILPIARKSIVALRPIQQGGKFSEDNLCVKRPGSGISPMRWDELIGRPSNRDYVADELIDFQ
ncbi:MAG: N-acetylneuraminate synthase [Verrucomicrobiota bacterium]